MQYLTPKLQLWSCMEQGSVMDDGEVVQLDVEVDDGEVVQLEVEVTDVTMPM